MRGIIREIAVHVRSAYTVLTFTDKITSAQNYWDARHPESVTLESIARSNQAAQPMLNSISPGPSTQPKTASAKALTPTAIKKKDDMDELID